MIIDFVETRVTLSICNVCDREIWHYNASPAPRQAKKEKGNCANRSYIVVYNESILFIIWRTIMFLGKGFKDILDLGILLKVGLPFKTCFT